MSPATALACRYRTQTRHAPFPQIPSGGPRPRRGRSDECTTVRSFHRIGDGLRIGAVCVGFEVKHVFVDHLLRAIQYLVYPCLDAHVVRHGLGVLHSGQREYYRVRIHAVVCRRRKPGMDARQDIFANMIDAASLNCSRVSPGTAGTRYKYHGAPYHTMSKEEEYARIQAMLDDMAKHIDSARSNLDRAEELLRKQ